ncbi:MAG: TatD family hydrolase [Verrucomicrobia bacterium]|nr:TatD family hydrolase [Verrucomicrobiota bacterium]
MAPLMAEFYDTHVHLDYRDFAEELPQVIERAAAAGITRLISIGTDLESSAKAVALADRFESVFAVVGWHPNDAVRAPKDFRAELHKLARHPKVVAIGETGLDYFRLPGGSGGSAADDAHVKARQAEAFQQQLEVAAETGLNCVIHTRGECFDETLAMLQPFASRVRGVFHCFVGTPEQMRRVLALNSLVSFTGIVTFKNAQAVRDTLAATPLGSFMLETDAPFLAPVPHRGKRCESAHVKEIAAAVAQVKGSSLEELSAATCQTAREFFPKLS